MGVSVGVYGMTTRALRNQFMFKEMRVILLGHVIM